MRARGTLLDRLTSPCFFKGWRSPGTFRGPRLLQNKVQPSIDSERDKASQRRTRYGFEQMFDFSNVIAIAHARPGQALLALILGMIYPTHCCYCLAPWPHGRGRIALGLNGPCLTVLMLEDEIDTAIATPPTWVFIPQPHLGDLGRPLRVGCQKPFYKVLELSAPSVGVSVQRTQQLRK